MPETPERRFAAVPDLRILEFDDEAVVFDPLSWDVHLLNPAAIAVLELLALPRTEAEIAAFLQEALQPAEQRLAALHAKRLIDELRSLGLLRPLQPSPRADR